MRKWRMLFTTLPYVAVTLALKLGVARLLDFHGLFEFSDIALVLTGGVFLIGFMLSGTITDFKEAEKMPADIACTLETIEEAFLQAAVLKPDIKIATGRTAVLDAGKLIWDWMHRTKTQDEMFAGLQRLCDAILELERLGAGPHASRAIRELHNLRKQATRIGVISRTGFVAAGYALLEVLTGAILTMTLAAHFKDHVTEGVLTGFLTLIFVYMIRLIRDIDDPFEYDESGQVGSAEVELFPLSEYLDRLRARLK